MTHIQLQPHVGYGLIGDRCVFLDVARDRYFALPPSIERVFRQLSAADEPTLPEGPDRDRLLGTGLFRTDSLRGRGLRAATVPPCAASVLDESARPRAGLRAILAARASIGRARKQLATRSLHEIVDAIHESRHAATPADDAAGEDAARLFLAARTLLPVDPRCLLDCLALLDWLGDHAKPATLVFGVRLEPFAAHCWLQTDRLYLTDTADALGAFTPVFSV